MLEVSYYGLSFLMTLIIVIGYSIHLKKVEADVKKRQSRIIKLSAFFVLWFAYLAILSETKVLTNLSLPPRFILFLMLPLLIICILFYRKKRIKSPVKTLPKTWTTYYQTFRVLVEVIILYTFYKGIMPIEATFEGYNFDIIMGISAPFVGYFVVKPNRWRKFQYFWNIFGIAMIVFVALTIGTLSYFPSIWGYSKPQVNLEFFSYPYILLAGFLAPSGIFIHVVSLVQLRNK